MFGLSVSSVLKHWDHDESLQDLPALLRAHISQSALTQEIESSLREENFSDAKMYLDIAKFHQYQVEFSKYLEEIALKDTSLNRISHQITDFSRGFLRGEASNTAGFVGSLSADFTVIGDARDLHQQYNLYEKGEKTNELIIVLSGAGIGLTAVTLGSLGIAAPIKMGTSLLKVATKTQRLTLRFQKILLKSGRKAFDWPAFRAMVKQDKSIANVRHAVKQAYHPNAVEPLKLIAKRISNIRQSSSAADTIQMLKYIETTDDLRHLEKVTVKYGSKTKGMMKLLGKGAIRTVRVLRKTTVLMISVITGVISSLLSLFFMMGFRRT